MLLRDAVERAARGRAHADRADALALGFRQQALEVDARKRAFDLSARAGIQQVVEDLRRIDVARVEHAMERFGIAVRRDAEEPNLALALELLERGNHFAHDVVDADRAARRHGPDRVVELQHVNARHAETAQARLARADHGATDIAEVLGTQPHLRADVDVEAELAQRLAEMLLGDAVAVARPCIALVDAALARARDRAPALRQRALDDETADVAAAEPQHGDVDAGPA